jgi:hypothetical protein
VIASGWGIFELVTFEYELEVGLACHVEVGRVEARGRLANAVLELFAGSGKRSGWTAVGCGDVSVVRLNTIRHRQSDTSRICLLSSTVPGARLDCSK